MEAAGMFMDTCFLIQRPHVAPPPLPTANHGKSTPCQCQSAHSLGMASEEEPFWLCGVVKMAGRYLYCVR